VRKDLVREVKIDDEVFEILHDHQIVPDPVFAIACREQYFVHPEFMSVSRSDINCATAFMWLAAARDAESMAGHVPTSAAPLLKESARILRKLALESVGEDTVGRLELRISQLQTRQVTVSAGSKFEDGIWYGADVARAFDAEILRALPPWLDGSNPTEEDVAYDIWEESRSRS
jgi:hypothetical protein